MADTTKPTHPEIAYAERSSATEPEKNIIYFTINAPNIEGEPKLDIKPTEISFFAKTGSAAKGVPSKDYAFDIQLYDEIIPEETKKQVSDRAIVLILRKKTAKAEYWPRLTKEKPNRNWVKTDFSKASWPLRWVDEDEQDGAEDAMGGMGDMGDMGGMGGMGGMPGMEGMGGMGGMGGMPGMGGMGGMGGMPGMGGGPGGMDFASMMQQMGGAGGMGGMPGTGGLDGMDGLGDDDDDDDADADDEGGDAKGADDSKVEEIEEIGSSDKGKGKADLNEVE